MPRPTTTKYLPLRHLRQEAGLSLPEAAQKLTEKMGREIKPSYVNLLEHRGTPLYVFIEAFAAIYSKPIPDVAAAARSEK